MKSQWIVAFMCFSALLFAGGSPFIGIFLQDPTDEQVKTFDSKGVMIEGIIPGTPAEQANLKKNCLIVDISGKPVTCAADLRTIMTNYNVGDTIVVKMLCSKGKSEDHTLILTDRGEKQGYSYSFTMPEDNPLGLTLTQITPQLREYFGVPYGVMVSEIEIKSSADSAGIKAGDILMKIDGAIVDSPENVRNELAKGKPGQKVAVEVNRRGERKALSLVLNHSVNVMMSSSRTTTMNPQIYLYDQSLGQLRLEDFDNLDILLEKCVEKAKTEGKKVDTDELRKRISKLQKELQKVQKELEEKAQK
jgi:C-terminal processing protease CtpA/Prc